MNRKIYYLSILLAGSMLFLHSCKKDDVAAPVITFSISEETINVRAEETIKIEATVSSGGNVSQAWYINERVVSNNNVFEYSFDTTGTYAISYKATNNVGEVKKQYTVKVAAPIRVGGSSAFVDTLFEFLPAPGQFINKAPGNLESAKGIVGKTGMVSLGAWGGYVIYGFDHSVANKDGNDIDIMGNALPEWSEPGIVYVMADDNGNGKPDDSWYELAGSEFGKAGEYMRNYEVTYFRTASANDDVAWQDNKGGSGFVKKNNFHKQAYYPDWITADQYTLKGSWLKSKLNLSNPGYVTNLPHEWGYADNLTNANGGNKVDISNTVNAQGSKVNLSAIDFIKIQNAALGDGVGWVRCLQKLPALKTCIFQNNKMI
ncbi:PKD-like domain-containing protein [Niabella ginsengisoli]|uniref:PKD domain-containing protein n=1 Tax=Niabella ginsengisoli TaxID=522298 RepID=A0ABS9SNQ1_9BACT|nr:PKD-like domain-containing protein [Niabella ginsengisoli]MCH5599994.1 hypothetical protein [Niabella ginsengisoli]